ncbi:MAG: DUF4445 domain-containing protein [Clostridiales bacterium]|nr:DUF4445 domain-containing protein [Clostridiales bacterium]
MEYIVRLHGTNRTEEKRVQEGTNLLDFLRRNSVEISAPCGGNRTCGKCRIKVEGVENPVSSGELKLLGDKALSEGYRLACHIDIRNDIDVFPDDTDEKAVIMTERQKKDIILAPIIEKKHIKLSEPGITDQKSDMQRILGHHSGNMHKLGLDAVRKLPDILRQEKFSTTYITTQEVLRGIEAGDTTDVNYGIAIDIGTTTIAAYLIDLANGNEKEVYSCMNPQRNYGADVISRISYTIENENGLEELNEAIVSCLNKSISNLTQQVGIDNEDVYAVVIAGNTTMIHLLLKIPPKNIAAAPFIPVTTDLHILNPGDINLNINSQGITVIMPAVSAYIGSDIVAAVLSSGMHEDEKISLLIDIGTNGEVVLGNKDWMYSCSVAAGPAFEGAQIKNGVGGIAGAIDTMKFSNGIQYTTIDGKEPVGICGSGIVDAIAGMLDTGIIDEMGRMVDNDELTKEMAEIYSSGFEDTPKGRVFRIIDANSTGLDTDIVISQRDVRELQNAKAAVAAGIISIVKKAGIVMSDIENVYLAGGFGSYLDINSTLRIGLIPKELDGKIKTIGNAAGSGAVEVLMNKNNLQKAEAICKNMKYIELSADKGFVDEYIDAMEFINNKANVH